MRINSLKVRNFRHFKNYKLSLLDDKFNLIVWENWAWKTTFFDAFRILFDSNLYTNNLLNEKDFLDWKELFIEVLLSFTIDEKNLYLFKDCINEVKEQEIDILIWFYQKNLDSEWIYYWKRSFISEELLDFDQEIKKFRINMFEIKKNIQVVYIDWNRTSQNFYGNNSFYTKVWKFLSEKDKITKLIKLNKDELKKNEIMKKIIDKDDSSNFTNFLNKIKLIQDSEDTNVSLDNDDNLPQYTFLNLIKLNLYDKHLDKNSTGWQYIIFTIFVIFYIKELEKSIRCENEEEKFYLILMEEPEAHLHPQMQRNLLSFIKEEIEKLTILNLLVSTHSPNIIRAIKDIRKTIFINKKSEKSLPENLDWEISKFKSKLNIFIDVNKAEMIFSRWIIFVEWISEEILIPRFFEIYNWKTLDNYWITVINVNSTDFYCYGLYADILAIPYVVITDWDITKDEGYRWVKRKSDHTIFTNDNYFIGFDTFEIDLIFEWNKDKILEAFLKNDTKTRKDNFSSAINRLLPFDYYKGDEKLYKDKYESIRTSILDNYISKSNLAYSLYSNIDNTFKIPKYIKSAFDWILSKL